jgi:hypothetical protein
MSMSMRKPQNVLAPLALLHAPHCQPHQPSQPANLRVGQGPMAGNRLYQLILRYDADILCPGNAVLA